ncbi:MAG: SMP-30/gluconolactonase/LRE family protein [Candidatus Hydrogenedentes bacterium]|nr:SMP-30/gluconolactonase/LRE family protein [Candidatus Hydrogenedentota bacterium]
MEPELIADYGCECGEGPLWHSGERKLYWTDIPRGRLYRYDPATGAHEQCYEGDVIGGFTIQSDGALLLFMARGAIKTWRDGKMTTIHEEIPNETDSRFNDVIADPEGRVFCGTMPCSDRLGRLYRLDCNGQLTRLLDGIGCSNGMGFSLDRKQMYYVDSPTREIYSFDYEQRTGAIRNQRVFVTTPEGEGNPDGITVDAEGFVWCAKWDGSALVRYSPEGVEERRYMFPAKKVSSVTFGGDDYRDVYVTTAGGHKKETEGAGAGGLFRLRPGIQGVPEFQSKVALEPAQIGPNLSTDR